MGRRAWGRSGLHRSLLKRYAGYAAAGLAIALPALLAVAAEQLPDRVVVHLLNRLAFGPTFEEFRQVKTFGVERYIAEQLNPDSIPEPIELRWRLAQLDTLRLNPVQLRQLYGPLRVLRGFRPNPELERAQRERVRIILRDASDARVLRALLSARQLQEVMVDFWFNHFNVFSGKGLDDVWIGNYEQQAIRPFVLGRFRDLLFATTKHPAMLVYLDNALSTAPGSPGARGRQMGLNENFAREVMELHTLGADGGYTQEDVVTLARVLTGWGVNPPDARFFPEHAAVFEGARHDYSPKVFLGHALQSHGKSEGEEALDILARSPATARHISYELAQYFVADEPPAALVERLAARFVETDGHIREVLRTLFASKEFWDSRGAKYKTPYQFVISAVRAAGAPVGNVRPLIGAMDQLGMPLFGCLTPDGYKNTEDAWLSPDATTRRISFVTALVGTNPKVIGAAQSVGAERLEAIFGSSLSDATRTAIKEAPKGMHAALILGGPDFMRR
ncbi:MAG: DUF1800 domain-containing protein [Alphaproteobacteria bacterium]|nr:DUF1800 domain-containing protein [Alphaproteobacteria bacterium]